MLAICLSTERSLYIYMVGFTLVFFYNLALCSFIEFIRIFVFHCVIRLYLCKGQSIFPASKPVAYILKRLLFQTSPYLLQFDLLGGIISRHVINTPKTHMHELVL